MYRTLKRSTPVLMVTLRFKIQPNNTGILDFQFNNQKCWEKLVHQLADMVACIILASRKSSFPYAIYIFVVNV